MILRADDHRLRGSTSATVQDYASRENHGCSPSRRLLQLHLYNLILRPGPIVIVQGEHGLEIKWSLAEEEHGPVCRLRLRSIGQHEVSKKTDSIGQSVCGHMLHSEGMLTLHPFREAEGIGMSTARHGRYRSRPRERTSSAARRAPWHQRHRQYRTARAMVSEYTWRAGK